jgi:hypothetical protein
MQGAAKGGYPMQATPNGVVEADEYSHSLFIKYNFQLHSLSP